MDQRTHKGGRCKARASATICRTFDQGPSDATAAELQFGQVPSACSKYQRNICGSNELA
jgi:hypothetical protein